MFDIVDSQVHLTQTMTAERIVASMDELGIDAAIIDEFWGLDGDRTLPNFLVDGVARPVSPHAHAAAMRMPARFSFLQRVDARDPQLAEWVALLASVPGCRGLRLALSGQVERASFTDGGCDHVLDLARPHALCVCVFGADAAAFPSVARRHPDVQFVLDHCGWPKSSEHWEAVLRLGTVSNVVLKWSHAHRVFGAEGQYEATRQREFLRAVDAFGADRIMWASDVTADQGPETWVDLLAFVRDNPALSCDAKSAILGSTARRVFNWPKSGGHG